MVWELACLCPGDSVAWGTACGPAEGPCDSWARLGPYVGPVAMPRVPGSAGRPGAWRSAHPCRDPFVAVGVIASPARVPGPRVPKPPHRSAGAANRTRAPPLVPDESVGGEGCPGGSNPVTSPAGGQRGGAHLRSACPPGPAGCMMTGSRTPGWMSTMCGVHEVGVPAGATMVALD